MSPGIWEKNLAMLHSRYPELAQQVEKNLSEDFLPQTTRTTGIENYPPWFIEPTPSGYPTLLYQEAGGASKILIHSQRDPFREAQRQAENSLAEIEKSKKNGDENTGRIIILLGMGLGYTAEALAQKNITLIIVERRREIFTLALKSRDLENLLAPGNSLFVLGDGSAAINAALSLVKTQKPLVIKNRALTGLTEEDTNWYDDVERRINTWASKEEINAATLERFGKRWTRNLAANMDGVQNFPGVRYLENLLSNTGIPVFLAAAGPSLNDTGKHLPQIHRRCIIIAVDTSLRFLLLNGVEPDFVFSVDPQYWNAQHLYRLSAPNTALVAESAVYPAVLQAACGGMQINGSNTAAFRRVFLCQSLFPLGRFIEDRTDPKGVLAAGGSVATTAWDFARFLDPGAIWIAGLDLAFPGYHTHYRGALFEENAHAASSRLCPAETLSIKSLENGVPFPAASTSGGKVLTDKRLSLYAAWFENRFELASQTNFSLSPGGLAIRGITAAKQEELLSLPPRREEIDELLNSHYRHIDAEYSREQQEREARYLDARSDLTRGLTEIRDYARDAASIAKKIPARPSADETARALKKLGKANDAIAKSPVKGPAGFLFPPMESIEEGLRETDPLKRHLEFSGLFYQALAESVEYTLGFIKNDAPRG